MSRPVARVGLSIAVVELLAGAEGAKRATDWWSKFWDGIDDVGGHWLHSGFGLIRIGKRLVRKADVAYVWHVADLEAGRTTQPTCGVAACVKHLRVLPASRIAA